MANYTGQSGLTKIFTLIKSKFNSLSTVATSGSYTDLSNKPVAGVDYVTPTEFYTVAMLAAESNFRSYVNSRMKDYDFDYLCIEVFDTSNDIDTTKDDGAYIVSNCYDSARHIINKNTSDVRTIQSRKFEVSSTPYHVWVYADYDGEGTIKIYFSKNNGTDWVELQNNVYTDLNMLVQKDIRVKIEMTGKVRFKNIAWGVS